MSGAVQHDPAAEAEFYVTGEEHGHESPTVLGFWIYLMSDALIFATLFATFGVLGTAYAGGPTPREIFELPLVALNTALLLVSSITYGFAMMAMHDGKIGGTRLWLVVTALLGMGFVGIELYEFGNLTAFFTLVATHGLHVTAGIAWIGVMLVQLAQRGLHPENQRRLMCLSMFWHFLDVVWIGVFTFVYLLGVLR
jgi:cytochrome o ubiquinol oxidase subunit III